MSCRIVDGLDHSGEHWTCTKRLKQNAEPISFIDSTVAVI